MSASRWSRLPLQLMRAVFCAPTIPRTDATFGYSLSTSGRPQVMAAAGAVRLRSDGRPEPRQPNFNQPRSTYRCGVNVLRYTAFSADPLGGNPAGVVLDASGLADAQMQAIAAEVGFSETAFVVARHGADLEVRYSSPLAEVSFCGHATIAAAVADAHRSGPRTLRLSTGAGAVEVTTRVTAGAMTATLTSVPPRTVPVDNTDLAELLATLDWQRSDLDTRLAPRVAFAGAWHPIIATNSRGRLANLDYDMKRLSMLMAAREWTTIDLVWRESETLFHCRNPFPPGGVVEDPATGAAAAAFGGYLRELGLVKTPATISIHQGDDMGRPGRLTVEIPSEPGSGISVSGNRSRSDDHPSNSECRCPGRDSNPHVTFVQEGLGLHIHVQLETIETIDIHLHH